MIPRNPAAWAILAAVLVVPGIFFYTWRGRLYAREQAALSVRVRNRNPDGVFPKDIPTAVKLRNPVAAAPPIAAVATVAAVAISSASAVVSAPAPAAVVPVPVAVPVVAVSSAAAIVIARDPTLSPYDLARMERESRDEARRRKELREGGGLRSRSRAIAEAKIVLQGIISSPESGSKAIVNGEVVGEGDSVGGVRVVKITAQKVVFSSNGDRFTKMFNK